ncbi:MAG: bifunctional phosphoglucose/phosphomannose isomerase, partial [Candidatus Colwellbacteria bacterium]|nr:bifunctional phosphoglucose/phosphomannose isomerase [Candidatus Colwellbacteria bacterium]
IPIIYSSRRNIALAYNWKIKFNETGKAPAFYNTFPELNHNEMTGFDVQETTRELSDKMFFIFLKDEDDHPKITKRMEVLERLYRDRKLSVAVVSLEGNSKMEKIFNSLTLADWTAYYTAKRYNVEPEQVPMVEEFKKLL